MSTPSSAPYYTQGFGSAPTSQLFPFFADRDAASTDINFDLGKIWINKIDGNVFILVRKSVSGGVTSATWEILGGGSLQVTEIETESGTAVPAGGIIVIDGDGSNITTSASGDTVVITMSATPSVTSLTTNTILATAVSSTCELWNNVTTGSIAMGNTAQTIDIGATSPTATRTISIAGGAHTAAGIADNIIIGGSGMSAGGGSRTVSLNSGTLSAGTLTTNIQSSSVSGGVATINVATGNRTSGTYVINIASGTGIKTVNLGNTDALTTTNVRGIVAVNASVNANVTVNSGTATGTFAVGNSAAGAATIESGAASATAISLNASNAAGGITMAAGSGLINISTTGGSIAISNAPISTNSNMTFNTAGVGLTFTTGSNPVVGTSGAMTGGTVTVLTSRVTSASRIFAYPATLGTVTVPQAYYITNIVANTSFDIVSQDATDTSTWHWFLIQTA